MFQGFITIAKPLDFEATKTYYVNIKAIWLWVSWVPIQFSPEQFSPEISVPNNSVSSIQSQIIQS